MIHDDDCKSIYKPSTVGILGGGQLGRMLGEAASRLGVSIFALDPLGARSPASATCIAFEGSFKDKTDVLRFYQETIGKVEGTTVLTVEIEQINVEALKHLESQGVLVVPSSQVLECIADKLGQKTFLDSKGVFSGEFQSIDSVEDILRLGEKWTYPLMVKTRFNGYDGRGNFKVSSKSDAEKAFNSLGGKYLYAEKWVPFKTELAVMVARSVNGEIKCFPVVETVQKDNICEAVYAPPVSKVSHSAMLEAERIAVDAIKALDGFGIFGVELFLLEDDKVMLNEIAPRPHNSGHFSLDSCMTDQFEQHLRAILGFPLGDTSLLHNHSAMLNLLGGDRYLELKEKALATKGAHLHDYGKLENRPGRKMAHINFTASTLTDLQSKMTPFHENLTMHKAKPLVGIIMGSDSDLPTMRAAADILSEFGVPFELTVVSAHRTPKRLYEYSTSAVSRGLRVIIAGAGGAAHLPGMVAALTVLPVIGVPVKTSALGGQDSLLSIVQMPRGIPVATVAIGNAMNAGLLALRMLGMFDGTVREKLKVFHQKQEEEVLGKAERMELQGYEKYLSGM